MDPAVSVVICTHNPNRDLLGRVLTALAGQALEPECREVILVDNHSTPPLEGGAAWIPASLSVRIVRETNLGLTHARLRGIREGRGALIVFVDDDNLLEPDYLQNALKIHGEDSRRGIWGGRIEPEFAIEPPVGLARHEIILAIRRVEAERWTSREDRSPAIPCGAGLCLRREVGEAYARTLEGDRLGFLLDRRGQSLASAGDTHLVLTALAEGWLSGETPRLRMRHHIPARRLEWDYLLRLYEEMAFSGEILNRLIPVPPQRPHDNPGVGPVRRLVRRLREDRRDREVGRAIRAGRHRARGFIETMEE